MLLSKKFIIWLWLSIFIITLANILSFYFFYSFYIKLYFYEKTQARDSVTIDYINDIIKKKADDIIDSVFSDAQIEFFELLETNNWKIPLDKEENVDIVVNYLIKSWLTPKYIEEIIPTDNFKKVLEAFSRPDSPEAIFMNRFILSILITNLVVILFITLFLWIFIRKTLSPISTATQKIKKMNKNISSSSWSWEYEVIEYKNPKDEIWLLVNSINNLNKKLALQNQIRTRLLADISHELKTPITSIQCYLEWISDWVITLNQKNLNSISSEMNRLISLVNRIMDYENFDRKKMELNLSNFDAIEVLKNISETHKKRLSQNKQRVKVTWENSLEINADKDLFIQLTHNLIWNFLKYAGKNTQLTINVTKKYIDFCDNWIWIKSSEIPFLTEKFYQGDMAKYGNVEVRWIWIGLSIVLKILESHNWRYEIRTDVGKWFSFKIFI